MELGFKLYFEGKTVSRSKSQLAEESRGDERVYRTRIDHVDVVWHHRDYAGGTLIWMEVSSQKPLGIKRVDSIVLSAGKPEITDHIAVIGRNANQNEIRFPHEFGAGREYGETVMGLYKTLDGEGLAITGVSPFDNVCEAVVCKDAEGSITFCGKTEYTQGMGKATALKTERFFIHPAITLTELFRVYRELLPQSKFLMPKLVGWNTWDYYLNKVTPEDIFENVAALKEMPFAKELKYIVLDDGWQDGWDSWRENETFACGLRAIADNIKEAGFIPGIWMAPVGVADVSVFGDRQDWLCRDENGELLQDMGLYYLDPTHPEVEKYVLDNYRYQYRAGFRLFKMDYVSPILKVKKFYDSQATPYGVLADLVRKVKECTGPDAVILGCSLPLECGADIAPAMRIGLDIHNHFTHVAAISRSISWSSVYNNRTTRTDPDFLIVRCEDTSKEPIVLTERNDHIAPPRALQTDLDRALLIWRHGDPFNGIEAETWANIVAVSGGNIFLSDRMSALNQRGIEIIQNAFEIAGEQVQPVYLKEDDRAPSLWKGDRALVLVNWEEIPRSITVTGITQKLVSKKPFAQSGDTLTVTLLPHESFAAVYA